MPDSKYGVSIGSTEVEQAVQSELKAKLHAYLGHVERKYGETPGSIARPRGWRTTNTGDFEKWPEDQMPTIIVVSPGTIANSIKRDGQGIYRAKWAIGIGAVMPAPTEERAHFLAQVYGLAISMLVIQWPSLGGFAYGVEWLDESLDEIPMEDSRTLASAQEIFEVEVRDIRSALDRPAPGDIEDPDDPIGPEDPVYPVVEEATFTVESVSRVEE